MSRTFAYLRVSTADQDTANQLGDIAAAGFTVEPQRVVSETVSGSTQVSQRPGFQRLRDRLERGDILIVTKLDRLGRNAIDVTSTVKALGEAGVRVYCLALGGMDLTSSAGKMTMGVIAHVAEFERDLIVERTQAGLARTKAAGTVLGRPKVADATQVRAAMAEPGASVRKVAKQFGIGRATVARYIGAGA